MLQVRSLTVTAMAPFSPLDSISGPKYIHRSEKQGPQRWRTGAKEATMAITLSHGGPTIYRSAAPSKQVLVGTIQGVVRIERDLSGSGWHVADRTLPDKHVHAV